MSGAVVWHNILNYTKYAEFAKIYTKFAVRCSDVDLFSEENNKNGNKLSGIN